MLRLAGAAQLAREWGDYTKDATPDLSLWDYPDTWLEGDHQVAVGERTIDAVSTPGHTQGHFVFADLADQLLFAGDRSEEHTSELQSLMRISYAGFCLKK